MRNKTVDTTIGYDDGRDDLHAPLGSVVVAAKLGGAQRAQTSAQTRQGMVASLTRQAEALREIIPLLVADGGTSCSTGRGEDCRGTGIRWRRA